MQDNDDDGGAGLGEQGKAGKNKMPIEHRHRCYPLMPLIRLGTGGTGGMARLKLESLGSAFFLFPALQALETPSPRTARTATQSASGGINAPIDCSGMY
jgi:hypothetical protein